jgi:hypothetical protein
MFLASLIKNIKIIRIIFPIKKNKYKSFAIYFLHKIAVKAKIPSNFAKAKTIVIQTVM